jgi:hypothetical protein
MERFSALTGEHLVLQAELEETTKGRVLFRSFLFSWMLALCSKVLRGRTKAEFLNFIAFPLLIVNACFKKNQYKLVNVLHLSNLILY